MENCLQKTFGRIQLLLNYRDKEVERTTLIPNSLVFINRELIQSITKNLGITLSPRLYGHTYTCSPGSTLDNSSHHNYYLNLVWCCWSCSEISYFWHSCSSKYNPLPLFTCLRLHLWACCGRSLSPQCAGNMGCRRCCRRSRPQSQTGWRRGRVCQEPCDGPGRQTSTQADVKETKLAPSKQILQMFVWSLTQTPSPPNAAPKSNCPSLMLSARSAA